LGGEARLERRRERGGGRREGGTAAATLWGVRLGAEKRRLRGGGECLGDGEGEGEGEGLYPPGRTRGATGEDCAEGCLDESI